MERNYPDEKSRPMILPVEWRTSLVLDDGLTDLITLPKMSSVRRMLNSTVLDIMYYQSPLYRKEVTLIHCSVLLVFLHLWGLFTPFLVLVQITFYFDIPDSNNFKK